MLRALNIDSLCSIGRFIKSRRHQSFIGEKGRIISRVVCVERIPDNLSKADSIHLLSWTDYLIKAESRYHRPPRCIKWGRWDISVSCQAYTSRHSPRDYPAEFIEWTRRQQSLRLVLTSNQFKLGCHKSYHPQSESPTAGKAQVGQNQTINRTANKENKVREIQ